MQGSNLPRAVVKMGFWTAALLSLAAGLVMFVLTACRLIG